jgi:hypothetical protein
MVSWSFFVPKSAIFIITLFVVVTTTKTTTTTATYICIYLTVIGITTTVAQNQAHVFRHQGQYQYLNPDQIH